MGAVTRLQQIRRRRARREKLSKLRERYRAAKSSADRERLLEKMKRVAPWLSVEEFLKPLRAGPRS